MFEATYTDDTVRTNTETQLGTLKEELAAMDSVENRISFVDQKIKGQKKFSTSLGMEDQAVLHAIWAGRCDIDVFSWMQGVIIRKPSKFFIDLIMRIT